MLRFILLLLLAASFTTGHADAIEVDEIFYEINGNSATVTGADRPQDGVVNIPESVDGIPVTAINSWAFSGWEGLSQAWMGDPWIKSVNIGNAVTTIGDNAFYGCTNLTSITIPSSVTSIGANAFYGCTSLTSITIPSSVTSIGDNAFYDCTNLTSIIFGNSMTSIGYSAFDNTGWYNSQPDGVVYAGRVAYKYKGAMPSGTSIVLKEGTLGIAGSAFYGCTNLAGITIPNSVVSIGGNAFYGCTSLSGITIPNSVVSIEYRAFYNCTNLASITIPNSVTSIGIGAFDNTLWFNNHLSDGMVYAGRVAYRYKGTMIVGTSITLTEGTLGIAGGAFSGCTNLAGITIPNSVVSIGGSAFSGCTSLASVNLGNSVVSIGSWAFNNCKSLTSITIPNSVTSIGDYAFSFCSSLTSVTIPNSVITIGESVFCYCSALKSVSIGSSVKKIGNEAFCYCPIEAVYITDLSAWCKIDFSFFDEHGWRDGWGGNPLSTGGNQARLYLNQEEVIDLVVPEDVYSVSWGAFKNCQSLRTVDTGPNLKYINGDAFRECQNLEEITIGENVQSCLSMYSYLLEEGSRRYVVAGYGLPFPEHVNRLVIKAKSCVTLGNPYTPYNWDNSGFDEIVIDEGVEVMPEDFYSSAPEAFYYNAINCSPQPSDYTDIPEYYWRDTPRHIFIGNKVETIVGSMFNFGVHPDTVTCYATVPPAIITECFDSETYNNTLLEVPKGTLNAYKNAVGWKEFLNIVEMENGSTSIPGDVNGSGLVNMDDLSALINYLLTGNDTGIDMTGADVNSSGLVNMDDLSTLINYLLTGHF